MNEENIPWDSIEEKVLSLRSHMSELSHTITLSKSNIKTLEASKKGLKYERNANEYRILIIQGVISKLLRVKEDQLVSCLDNLYKAEMFYSIRDLFDDTSSIEELELISKNVSFINDLCLAIKAKISDLEVEWERLSNDVHIANMGIEDLNVAIEENGMKIKDHKEQIKHTNRLLEMMVLSRYKIIEEIDLGNNETLVLLKRFKLYYKTRTIRERELVLKRNDFTESYQVIQEEGHAIDLSYEKSKIYDTILHRGRSE